LLSDSPENNVTEAIASKVGRNLHNRTHHPICTIKNIITTHFTSLNQNFEFFDDLCPVVDTKNNFDDLLVKPDHVSRRMSDTYYISRDTVLRTHTSAHQTSLLSQGSTAFLATGDVYRRDEIDSSHYPVFHQMEGVRVFSDDEIHPDTPREEAVQVAREHLKQTLEGMVQSVFGDVEMRWVDAYFPFTEPSIELEIFFQGDWLEVLGCGVVEQQIMINSGQGDKIGWAFGLGLERLAMVLFGIPDIRLFWSDDQRFISQFEDGKITKFKPYSKYPPVYKGKFVWSLEK